MEAFGLKIFHWGHFLVHPVGVAPKAPSNFLKLLGGLYSELRFEQFSLYQEACKLGTAFMKLQGEHEALKKKHAEDDGKLMFLATNQETISFHHVTILMVESVEAAKKAFEAKVKESDDFVKK